MLNAEIRTPTLDWNARMSSLVFTFLLAQKNIREMLIFLTC